MVFFNSIFIELIVDVDNMGDTKKFVFGILIKFDVRLVEGILDTDVDDVIKFNIKLVKGIVDVDVDDVIKFDTKSVEEIVDVNVDDVIKFDAKSVGGGVNAKIGVKL